MNDIVCLKCGKICNEIACVLCDPAPDFRCVKGHSTGARRDEDGVWHPQDCWRCRPAELQADAARRRREHPRVIAGVDVDLAVAALRKVPVLDELLDQRRKIKVDVGHTTAAYEGAVGGRAWGTRKMRVYGGAKAVPARVLEVVLHELCHLALPRQNHNERFRRVFRRAVQEAWGIDVPVDPDPGNSTGRRENVLAYRQGDLVVEALNKIIEQMDTFPPKAQPPKPTRAMRNAELVAKRQAHAEKMLKECERRLKDAKTRHRHWADKVRYYERQAARRAK